MTRIDVMELARLKNAEDREILLAILEELIARAKRVEVEFVCWGEDREKEVSKVLCSEVWGE